MEEMAVMVETLEVMVEMAVMAVKVDLEEMVVMAVTEEMVAVDFTMMNENFNTTFVYKIFLRFDTHLNKPISNIYFFNC